MDNFCIRQEPALYWSVCQKTAAVLTKQNLTYSWHAEVTTYEEVTTFNGKAEWKLPNIQWVVGYRTCRSMCSKQHKSNFVQKLYEANNMCTNSSHVSSSRNQNFRCHLIQAALYITCKSCSFPSLPSPTIFYYHPHSSIPEGICRAPFGIKFEKPR